MNTYKLTAANKARVAMRPVTSLAEGANQGADLSLWCGSVFNQEQEGSCTACTTRDYLLWLQNKMGYAPVVQPDVQALYYYGRLIFGDLSTDSGSTIPDAFQAPITYGVIPADDDAYTPSTLYSPPPVQDLAFHASGLQNLAPTTASIRATLDSGVPAGIAVGVSDTIFSPVPYDGLMIVDMGTVVPNEGHAILAVAYKPDPVHKFLYKFQNSWGTKYGQGGFAWFTEAYLDSLLREAGTLQIPPAGHVAPPDYSIARIPGPSIMHVDSPITVKARLTLGGNPLAGQDARADVTIDGHTLAYSAKSDMQGVITFELHSDVACAVDASILWTPAGSTTRTLKERVQWLPLMGFKPMGYDVTIRTEAEQTEFVDIATAHKWQIRKL